MTTEASICSREFDRDPGISYNYHDLVVVGAGFDKIRVVSHRFGPFQHPDICQTGRPHRSSAGFVPEYRTSPPILRRSASTQVHPRKLRESPNRRRSSVAESPQLRNERDYMAFNPTVVLSRKMRDSDPTPTLDEPRALDRIRNKLLH
jgi:hypothetical protein